MAGWAVEMMSSWRGRKRLKARMPRAWMGDAQALPEAHGGGDVPCWE